MTIRSAFTIPVGSLQLHVPAGRARVPGLLWGNMAIAAVLLDQGYEQIARDTLGKLQGWLDGERAADLQWPGEQSDRVGRKLSDGIQSGDGDLTWYVARSATRQERRAEDGLVEAGLVVYAPKLTRWRRSRHRKIKITRPLLPGYMFVGCRSRRFDRKGHDDDLSAIPSIEGVHAVVRFSAEGAPLPVPFFGDCSISSLLDEELAGEFDRTVRKKIERPEVKVGQAITVTRGPGAGFAHTFQGLDGEGRIKALFHLFGRPTPFTYDPDQVAEFADEE